MVELVIIIAVPLLVWLMLLEYHRRILLPALALLATPKPVVVAHASSPPAVPTGKSPQKRYDDFDAQLRSAF